MIITNPKTSESFNSSFETFNDALSYLRNKVDLNLIRSDFARNLSDKSFFSETQMFFVHKIASEHLNPQPKTPPIGTETIDFTKVISMIQHAYDNGAKRLKIRLLLEDGRNIALSPYAPSGSLVAVYVQDSHDFCLKYGKILPNGQFQPPYGYQEIDELVKSKILQFAADPLGVAKEYGIALGSCCFCAKTLSDERSIKLSYGPICARKFNLEVPY